jgi:diacylglycerol kinase family enzyme
VAVANSGVFGGGMYLAPGASLEDGVLDVVFIRACPKRRYLMNLPKVFKGTHVTSPDFTLLRGKEITFDADRPFAAYADGDPIANLPVTIKVVPRALKVLVP